MISVTDPEIFDELLLYRKQWVYVTLRTTRKSCHGFKLLNQNLNFDLPMNIGNLIHVPEGNDMHEFSYKKYRIGLVAISDSCCALVVAESCI